jgi:hypothetical protein
MFIWLQAAGLLVSTHLPDYRQVATGQARHCPSAYCPHGFTVRCVVHGFYSFVYNQSSRASRALEAKKNSQFAAKSPNSYNISLRQEGSFQNRPICHRGITRGEARLDAPPKSHEAQRRQCLKRMGIEEANWMELALNKNDWRSLIKKAGPFTKTKTPPRFKGDRELKPELTLGQCAEKQFKTKRRAVGVLGGWSLRTSTRTQTTSFRKCDVTTETKKIFMPHARQLTTKAGVLRSRGSRNL